MNAVEAEVGGAGPDLVTTRVRPCGKRSERLRATCAALLLAAIALVAAAPTPALAEPSATAGFEGLVDVGGYRLYLRCTGEGSPTVVFDAALGATSESWRMVEPVIADYTPVCVYDRAGMGRSDPGPVPRTSQTMVDELRTLLRNAGIAGPYVLVGHSLGGLNVQLFARQDGGVSVVGVVLVDATPAELFDRFAEVLTPEQLEMALPPAEKNRERVDLRTSSQQVLSAPDFPAVPLQVLTHTIGPRAPGFPNEELERIWQELQQAQSQLSPQGQLVVAEGARHFIQLDRPDLVIDSILGVVEAARAQTRPGRGCGDRNHFHERKVECKQA